MQFLAFFRCDFSTLVKLIQFKLLAQQNTFCKCNNFVNNFEIKLKNKFCPLLIKLIQKSCRDFFHVSCKFRWARAMPGGSASLPIKISHVSKVQFILLRKQFKLLNVHILITHCCQWWTYSSILDYLMKITCIWMTCVSFVTKYAFAILCHTSAYN